MDCSHDQMSIQNYNEKIMDLNHGTNSHFLKLILSQIKSRIRFVFVQNMKMRKSELCFIKSNFNNFEDMIKEKVIERDFFFFKLSTKINSLSWQIILCKKIAICCFLDDVYIYLTRLLLYRTPRKFHVEDIIDDLLAQKLSELKEDFYEKKL